MQLRLGRPDETRRRGGRRRRTVQSAVVSIGLHVVVLFALWKAIQVPVTFERWLYPSRSELPRENLRYLPLSPPPPATPEPGPSRPAAGSGAPVAPPLIAPREVPSGIPAPPPASAAPGPTTPAGPLGGGTGPVKGIQPALVDPRIWVEDPPFVYAPKTPEERLDSALIASIKRKQDSIAANTYSPNKFERGDWTVDKGGGKYGIDPDYIRLGRFSIPTALLALLPFNRGGSPVDPQRDRNMAAMRSSIAYHAQTALNEAEFRAAVRAIRDRKERDRKAQPQQLPRRRNVEPGATSSPCERPPQ